MQVLTCFAVVLATVMNLTIGKARAERECMPKGTWENCTKEPRFKNCSHGQFFPEAMVENSTYSGTVGTNVTMICVENNLYNIGYFDWIRWDKGSSDPHLDIDIGPFQLISHTSNDKYKIQSKPGHNTDMMASSLTIFNLTEYDQGLYACVICGNYGRDFKSVIVKVFEGLTSKSGTSAWPVSPSSVTVTSGGKLNNAVNQGKMSDTHLVIIVVTVSLVALLIITGVAVTLWWKGQHKFDDIEQLQPSVANPAFGLPDSKDSLDVPRKRLWSETSTISCTSSLAPLLKERNGSTRSPLCSNTSAITEFSYTDELTDYSLDEKWEIDRSCLLIKEQIGAGAFGAVNRAVAFGLPGMPQQCTVAIKMLKENAGDSDLLDLIAEIETLKGIGNHKNIVNLIGTCTVGGPVLLVVDYAPHGNLREFLRKHRPSQSKYYETHVVLTVKDLLSFAFQVARGMVYLSSQKCIHRDLAARNVLVAKDYVMKISDFGLSRNLKETDYYRKTSHGRLPVKWLPPEALFDQQYTVKSDVWSFGVLLWEIFTMGGIPYPAIEVEKLFTLLKNGYRMEAPSICTSEISDLMLDCWQNNPKARPPFVQIERSLEQLLISTSDQEYLEVLAKPEDLKNAALKETACRTTPAQKTGRETCIKSRV